MQLQYSCFDSFKRCPVHHARNVPCITYGFNSWNSILVLCQLALEDHCVAVHCLLFKISCLVCLHWPLPELTSLLHNAHLNFTLNNCCYSTQICLVIIFHKNSVIFLACLPVLNNVKWHTTCWIWFYNWCSSIVENKTILIWSWPWASYGCS